MTRLSAMRRKREGHARSAAAREDAIGQDPWNGYWSLLVAIRRLPMGLLACPWERGGGSLIEARSQLEFTT